MTKEPKPCPRCDGEGGWHPNPGRGSRVRYDERNVEENRLQIIFPGKPDADVRAKLKASGFRWSPTSGAWQRHLGNSAIWAAETLLKEIRAKESA